MLCRIGQGCQLVLANEIKFFLPYKRRFHFCYNMDLRRNSQVISSDFGHRIVGDLFIGRRFSSRAEDISNDTSLNFGYNNSDKVPSRMKDEKGLHHINLILLPEILKKRVNSFVKRYPRKALVKDGQKLTQYLKNRGRPTERSYEKYKEYKRSLTMAQARVEPSTVETGIIKHEDKEAKLGNKELIQRLFDQDETISQLKRVNKPSKKQYTYIRYKERESAAYLASRVMACYGATLRVLHEIKKKEPSFNPKTLLDFGSGTGTAIWAAHALWGDYIKEYQCVDISDHMNNVNQYLLRGTDDITKACTIPSVYFSKYMPLSHKVTYDIVIAAYTLSELPTSKQRKLVLTELWKKTNDFLVIIEIGNNEGFDIALQARDFVTKHLRNLNVAEVEDESDDTGVESEIHDPGHVFSPCPHDDACARSEVDFRSHPCNFDQKVELAISQKNTSLKRWSFAYERFSHIVLRKGSKDMESEERSWPRLLKPVKKRKGHILCELCCEGGSIERHVLTKGKDKNIYKGIRHCAKWGDQVPPSTISKKPLQVFRPPEEGRSSPVSVDTQGYVE